MKRAIKTRLKFFISPKYKYLKKFEIRPDDVVIDLGANVGEVSEYFLLKRAHVEAYEPNPHAFNILQNRLGGKPGINIHRKAVSNKTGSSKLFLHENHNGAEVLFSQAGSLQGEKENLGDDYVEVELLHIRDVLNAHDKIRLIKIDIEGGEYDIMDEILAHADKIDYILLETHEKKNKVFQERHDKLMKNIETSGHKHKIFTDWF